MSRYTKTVYHPLLVLLLVLQSWETNEMNVTSREFFLKGMDYASRAPTPNCTNFRRFKSFYGTTAGCCVYLWDRILPHIGPDGGRHFHLLWALMFLKLYDSISVLSSIVQVDEKTFSKWTWKILSAISLYVKPRVICIENRFKNAEGASCLLSVDGTDCPTNQKFDSRFYSHKFKASGVRYEVGLCIQTGHICSVVGPFPCGEWPDVNIYRHWLKHQLREGERVEADSGYRGDPTIRHPDDCANWAEWSMKFNVRARHEHVNQRCKNFRILQHFRHFISIDDMEKHKYCFDSIATIVQLNILAGETLTPVEYVEY